MHIECKQVRSWLVGWCLCLLIRGLLGTWAFQWHDTDRDNRQCVSLGILAVSRIEPLSPWWWTASASPSHAEIKHLYNQSAVPQQYLFFCSQCAVYSTFAHSDEQSVPAVHLQRQKLKFGCYEQTRAGMLAGTFMPETALIYFQLH